MAVAFSTLTLSVGWVTGRVSTVVREKLVPLIPNVLCQIRWRRKTDGKPANPGLPGKPSLKRRWNMAV